MSADFGVYDAEVVDDEFDLRLASRTLRTFDAVVIDSEIDRGPFRLIYQLRSLEGCLRIFFSLLLRGLSVIAPKQKLRTVTAAVVLVDGMYIDSVTLDEICFGLAVRSLLERDAFMR